MVCKLLCSMNYLSSFQNLWETNKKLFSRSLKMTQKAPLNTHFSLILDDEMFETPKHHRQRSFWDEFTKSWIFGVAHPPKFSFYVPHFLLKGREHFSNIPIRIIGWHVQFLIYWPITVFLQETTLTQTRADHWKGRVRSSCFIWNERSMCFPDASCF